MKDILIIGTMGAGKDTLAGMLVSYGYNIRKLGKYIRNHVDMLNYEKMYSRALYQQYGQACRDMFGANVWNEALYKQIENDRADYQTLDSRDMLFVIADGRQANELEYWINKGFATVGIYASEKLRDERLKERDSYSQKEYFKHETELQAAECLNKCRFVIDNNGTLLQLQKQVDKMVNILRGE